MAFIVTVDDLKTHIYEEHIEEISRSDGSIAQQAIDRAIAQAKGYCSRFELVSLFGSATVNPTVTDYQLKGIVKDLALWHLIQLANPNIEMSRAQAAYEYAVSWLKDVQKGFVQPEGWTYHNTATDADTPQGNAVFASSNPKRSKYF